MSPAFASWGGVIRDMSDSEKYRAFMKGVKPHIRQYVGPNVRGDLDAAILMAEQFDLYRSPESSSQGGSRNQGNQGKKGEKQKKGTIHVVEVQPAPIASSAGQVQAVESKKKQINPQQCGKKGKKGKSRTRVVEVRQHVLVAAANIIFGNALNLQT